MLGRVAGGVEDLEGDLAHLQDLAVGDAAEVVAEVGPRQPQHLDVLAQAELGEAAHVVGVAVGVDRIGDPEAVHPGGLEVDLDVTSGIEDERLAGPLVADEVGGVTEALQVELLEDHHYHLLPADRLPSDRFQ